MTDDLLQTTFHHFDTGNNGVISADDFRILLGDTFEGQPVADLYGQFLAEAGITAPDGKLDYDDFAKYSRACAPKRPLGSGGSTPSRNPMLPKLWARINSFHSNCGSPTAPPLPTLLRDMSPANRWKARKPAADAPENDEVLHERSCSKPVLLPGIANLPESSPVNPRQRAAPKQGSQGPCCSIQ